MERVKGGIVSVTMDAPTIHGLTVNPGLVNFFYGKNGTGKTSIGRALAGSGGKITWDMSLPQGAKVYLYNEDTINRIIRNCGNEPGIYAFSEENVQVQQAIEETEKQQEETKKKIQEMREKLEQMRSDTAQTEEEHLTAIWRAAADYRKKYEIAIIPFNEDIRAFAEHLADIRRESNTDDNLEILYQLGYSQEPTEYSTYEIIPASSFPVDSLLDIPFVSHGDSVLSVFFQTLQNLDWVKQGFESYQHNAGCQCPYCGQQLPGDFKQKFEECLDTQYRDKMEKLEVFFQKYSEASEKAKAILTKNLTSVEQEREQYKILAELLAAKMSENLRIIQQKIASPRQELHLTDIDGIIERINKLASGVNTELMHFIEAAKDIPKARERAKKQIWQTMAAHCGELIDLWKKEKKKSDQSIRRLDLKIQAEDSRITHFQEEIQQLRNSMADTSMAMNKINAILKSNGFTGFYFREKEDKTYELVRESQENEGPAVGLSEGERNHVAFLYFYHTVLGSLSEDGQTEDKIVIIDDPVCSIDSEAMPFDASLVRSLIQKCIDRDHCAGDDAHILQVFCLTHNPLFYRLISDCFVQDHEHCVYFLVKKDRENNTSIMECSKQGTEIDGNRMNYSPVKDDYHSLWRQYIKMEDPQDLISITRQILCQYFLLTCHHDGLELQKLILVEHKDDFVPPDAQEWQTSFNIVSAMVSLMNLNSHGTMQSLYFDFSAVDPAQIRFVFQKIFQVMHQEQHYRYMMDAVNQD